MGGGGGRAHLLHTLSRVTVDHACIPFETQHRFLLLIERPPTNGRSLRFSSYIGGWGGWVDGCL